MKFCLLQSFVSLLIAICCINRLVNAFCHKPIDRKCQVDFNTKQCWKDYDDTIASDKSFQVCYNQTTQDADAKPKNKTLEISHCVIKCMHGFAGYLNADGTFNLENIATKIRTLYKTYSSNATTAYVEKFASLAKQCIKIANEKLEYRRTVDGGKRLGKCAINGFFEGCYQQLAWSSHHNITWRDALCAAQGTFLKSDANRSTN